MVLKKIKNWFARQEAPTPLPPRERESTPTSEPVVTPPRIQQRPAYPARGPRHLVRDMPRPVASPSPRPSRYDDGYEFVADGGPGLSFDTVPPASSEPVRDCPPPSDNSPSAPDNPPSAPDNSSFCD